MSLGTTDRVSIPRSSLRNLIRDYYVAQKGVNGQFSGDLKRDWSILATKVQMLSVAFLDENFDFGEDEYIYGGD